MTHSDTTVPRAPETQSAPTGRLPLLDVLRGVAILGTLMTNVWIFTGPGAEWGALQSGYGELSFGSFAGAVEGTFNVLGNGKFLSLLTILFGVGLAIQYGSAARRGQPWPGRYRWRALFLFGEGTVHFVLVFAWDVLMGYAVIALFVAWLLTRSARAQRRVMWWAAGLHLAVLGLLTAATLAASDSEDGGTVSREVVDLYAHGDYLDQVAFRLENAIALRMEPVLTFFLLVFLFLLGVRLYRAGAFGADETGRRLRSRLLLWGLGLGLPLNVAAALGGTELFLPARYGAAPLLALGYIGLTGALVDRVRRPGPLMTGLTSVGRTALSGYVLQNVLCVLVSYGIGLGLAERLDDTGPWWVVGLWAVVCATLMVGSTLWLRRFTAGPLEAVQKWALRH
ncbi:DUF418 domain-containing protein [Streptomyces sp. ISL-22]|uniref:DUF418 domain-containing protein n=1 Tax=unclassified Streptomyces TaxID=2593676 RepID=UPI001BE6C7AF|nr:MULTISPECIES: DUF418 domain-containing protein [unclassified Streptomyces]MBT2420837.1 DUF418 domain-containing protein [Streptomyces sp. ISL-24]MBT2434791.1 DUF418 domain-containing protein [Streptomyces sp. ISL-22]